MNPTWSLFVCFVFSLFGHTHSIWKFPGQGSNPSQSCNLHHSCSNTRPLTHCAGPGIKLAPPQRQATSLIHCITVGTPDHCWWCLDLFLNSVWYFVEDQTSRIECGVVYVFKIEECANKGMENGKLKLQKRKNTAEGLCRAQGQGLAWLRTQGKEEAKETVDGEL